MDSSDSSYYSRQQLDELFLQMIAFFSGDPKRIQHFMKVHSFARIIGTKEGLDETSLFILEAAAYTHDIGIRPADSRYGRSDNFQFPHRKAFSVPQSVLPAPAAFRHTVHTFLLPDGFQCHGYKRLLPI